MPPFLKQQHLFTQLYRVQSFRKICSFLRRGLELSKYSWMGGALLLCPDWSVTCFVWGFFFYSLSPYYGSKASKSIPHGFFFFICSSWSFCQKLPVFLIPHQCAAGKIISRSLRSTPQPNSFLMHHHWGIPLRSVAWECVIIQLVAAATSIAECINASVQGHTENSLPEVKECRVPIMKRELSLMNIDVRWRTALMEMLWSHCATFHCWTSILVMSLYTFLLFIFAL